MPDSFLFYDLETFGQDPRRTRIAQFAAQRTDAALNPVEDPVTFYVKPADDLLPSPVATLITGITPQHALSEGVPECDAIARIFEEMARPETCTLGWNTLRFDDEFVRHGLFRNFFDPYEREWRGGNSRWDLLDVARLFHALRPEGVHWPKREDGATSFKLEHLALANDVRTGDAHEAMSDVRATVGIARAMRNAQPRLWDYALQLRNKRFAASLLDTTTMTPVLHVSMRYPASRLCAAPVLPVARHPRIDSRIIVLDLEGDAGQALLDLDPQDIADRLYTPRADLPEDVRRVPLKEVHLNRCPALVPWNYLREADFERLGIDPAAVQAQAELLRAQAPLVAEKVRKVFGSERAHAPSDPDASIYDGFLAEGDKRKLTDVRTTPPAQLGTRPFGFKDPRLDELLFRYRARNWPQTLDATDQARWDDYRRQRLAPATQVSEYGFDSFFEELVALRASHADDGAKQVLLDQLEAYGRTLQAGL
ncbi:exodeoxyribonuclease I [Pseudoxanthomonas sp.]|uniref:exodeoxyribonuclease I n=1 Tax=Pseudoxanthomonas sp. TaxID=1871049 RepID=UPI002620D7A1|nr:exodeoxyribonuclease I [Pseudoxanthomonas sp.]WDS36748.1 MAG: exodeoxyribonuclease I [Pseudoxanthomonas sp.]